DFLKKLSKKYKTFLLSNINDLHIDDIRTLIDAETYISFLFYFEMIFYSHIIEMRKPNRETIEFVLSRNKLIAEETLFIDDSIENCKAAKSLGLKVWHLESDIEDIMQLENFM
ncbi:MAG TPA: HAD family phosphatase, partial [Flavobacteriia bacterium]|nr:HAD family phosphatase [Flavobacteriia bacterium]